MLERKDQTLQTMYSLELSGPTFETAPVRIHSEDATELERFADLWLEGAPGRVAWLTVFSTLRYELVSARGSAK